MKDGLLEVLLRLQRLGLALYPREFRRVLGADMRRSLESRARRVLNRKGASGLLAVALTDLAAIITGLPGEWLGRLRSPKRGERGLVSGWIDDALGDLKHAGRGLVMAPAFTLIAVVTLALGIGLNTAIFSVIQAVLLRPLPYAQPERLVAMNITFEGQTWWYASLADVFEWRELGRSFDSIAFGQPGSLGLVDDGPPEQVAGAEVSANWFETLGIAPELGRTFRPREQERGAARVAVLGHGFWQRHYGGDPGVVGETVRIDGEDAEIVGVMPASYRADFLERPDIYVTRQFSLEETRDRARIYKAVARLAPGVRLDAARAEMARVARRVAERNPETMAGWGIALEPLGEAIAGSQSDLLWSLLGGVGLVLLVACANVSNLLLARGIGRGGELALRAAVGGSRGRLVRQMLVEAGLLALLGGLGGLLLAVWTLPALLRLAPADLPRIDQTSLDPVVLAFTLGVALITGIAFGLVPALRASATAPARVLGQQTRGDRATGRQLRLSGWLVAGELGLVVTLLIGAVLMLQSFQALRQTDLGFDPGDKLLVFIERPTEPDTSDVAMIADFHRRLRHRVSALPGVEAVADVTRPPLAFSSGHTAFHIIEGREYPAGGEPTGGFEVVSPNYFEVMGMQRLEGRLLQDLDRADSAPVVVVNRALAELYWPDASPVGERIALNRGGGPEDRTFYEIVGVVEGVRYQPDREVRPRVYVADAQSPAPLPHRQLVVATSLQQPQGLTPGIRDAVLQLDPQQAVGEPRPYADVLAGSLADERLQTMLLGLFGVVALVLGLVGVYGVVSYAVSQRTREMGIRMALGARRRDVVRSVLRSTMALAIGGIAVGAGAAAILSRTLASFLHGVSPTDPLTYAGVAGLLLLVSLCASLLPASRAGRVDPAESLRVE